MSRVVPYAPTLILLLLCAILPYSALYAKNDFCLSQAFLFHFSHANIWHILANFYFIMQFKPRWSNLPVSYVSATLAAILLSVMPIGDLFCEGCFSSPTLPTVGISGMIFAMIARHDAILRAYSWRLLGLNILLAVIPCYNWKIHLLSYLIALIIWKIYLNLTNRQR